MHFVEISGYYPPHNELVSRVINLDQVDMVRFDAGRATINQPNSAPYIVKDPAEIEKLRKALLIGQKAP